MDDTADQSTAPADHAVSPPSARIRVAQGLAFLALVAALVGALGPAERIRTTYSWPPAELPAGAPVRAWYAPLLLIRHRPETVVARIPCALPAALPESPRPVTVLATARHPERVDGLAVRSDGRELSFSAGGEILRRVDLPTSGLGSSCEFALRLGEGRWSIEGGADGITLGGELPTMPMVTGLFSTLDLRAEAAPSIEVTTAVHAVRSVTRQAFAWTLAVVLIAAALALVAFDRPPRKPWRKAGRALGSTLAKARPVDGVVFAVLLGWWVLSPTFWDDGWILERVDMYSVSGGFSIYYRSFGATLPLDFWLEWAQHVLVDVSRALVFVRIPALVCLAGVWVLCRWILLRILQPDVAGRGVVVWTMASAFLVGALAWGMTLRPEPVTALLAAGVLACMVRFSQRETAGPLAVVTLVVPFALTGHHAGVAALAPILVCGPRVLQWARSHAAEASALVTTWTALLFVLLFVGADVGQRRDEALFLRGSAVNWRDEFQRYDILSQFPNATPLRRASFALIAIALLAWFLLRNRPSDRLRSLPVATLTVGLLLLVATPSKWPAHLGALTGFVAVALAVQTARLRDESEHPHRSRALPYIVVGAGVVAAAWSWWPRSSWNSLDLTALDWTLGLESWFPLVPLATGLPLILLGAAAVVSKANGRRSSLASVAGNVGSWTVSVLAAPLIVFTAGVLVADSVKASWTPARQNLEALWGDAGCGLGDHLLTAVGSSARPLAVAESLDARVPAWVPHEPVPGLRRFALAPVPGGFGRTAWFTLPADQRFGVYLSGRPGPTDKLGLEWGRSGRDRVVSLGTDRVQLSASPGSDTAVVSWRLVSAAELPQPRTGADVVRVTLHRNDLLATAVAVTAPVTYRNQTLTRKLQPALSTSLVYANVVTYFPCVRLPELRDGAVAVPRHIVVTEGVGQVTPLGNENTNPFVGLFDLYHLEHLPLSDSRNPPRVLLTYEVVPNIAGAMLVPPTARRWSS